MIRLTILGEPAMTRITYIYALVGPNSRARYVGKSDSPLHRFRRHLVDQADTRKVRWIRALARAGKAPTLRILQIVPFDQWQEAERAWIDRFDASQLTNSTAGGIGPLAPSLETRAKMRARKVGGVLTEEHRRKVSEALKGRPKPPRTPEHIAKIAAARRGVPMSATQREKHRETNLRRKSFGATGLKGVSFDKSRQLFAAHITVNQKLIHLGRHESAEDAARAYNDAARAHGWPEEGLNQI